MLNVNNMLREVLRLKPQGILDLDNCICLDNIQQQEVEKLQSYIQDCCGVQTQVVDLDFSDVDVNDSDETSALKFMVKVGQLKDTIYCNSDKLFLIKNFAEFYNNETTKFLKNANTHFLLWYLSFDINHLNLFSPIMFINSKYDASNLGIVNVLAGDGSDIVQCFQSGLQEVQRILQEVQQEKEKKNAKS